jgi:hypothetical protein
MPDMGGYGGSLGNMGNGGILGGMPNRSFQPQSGLGQMGNGGFYAPPAIRKGSNGGFVDPGTGQPYGGTQPMNPGQQSGQVGMRSPDGQHFQYVNAEHVPHYQGLGAQVYNGSSYGGGNG